MYKSGYEMTQTQHAVHCSAHRRVSAALFKEKDPNITRAPSYMSFRLFLCFVKKNTHFNPSFGGRHANYDFKKHTRDVYIA